MAAHSEERSVKPLYEPTRWLAQREAFEIERSGGNGAHGFAVLLGKRDISALLETTSKGNLRYSGRGPALPAGAHVLTVYDVSESGEWTQIGEIPIQILSRRGFASSRITPTADVTSKGEIAGSHTPDENAPARDRSQDATMQFGLASEFVRPAFTIRGQAQLAGVTARNEALRFSTDGNSAPYFDLANYRFDVQRGSTVFSVGHVEVGGMRHLLSGFSSRGVAVKFGEGKPISIELAAMNGTNVVGWDNTIGLASSKHRFLSATAGFEIFRATPGRLRIETAVFNGSSLPESSFNEGGVVSAETSRGGAIRLASTALNGRLKFDGAYTRSKFDDRFDPQAEEGLIVTPIPTRDSDAFYIDSSVALLQNRQFGKRTASVTLNLRHEHLEPQFRSLGASVQADRRASGAEMVWSVGSVAGTFSHARVRDNLADVRSVLTTRGETSSANLSIPLRAMFGESSSRALPSVQIQFEMFHQYGDHLPTGGDFTLESIPDQLSFNSSVTTEWEIGSGRIGGRFGHTKQDNRQLGSELSDFATNTAAFTFGWSPAAKFTTGGELGFDRNHSTEQRKSDLTLRWGANFSWTFFKEAAFAMNISNSRGWDSLDLRESDDLNGFAELSTPFRLSRSADKRKGRIFIRYVDQRADVLDRAFLLRSAQSTSAVATGLTVSLF